MENYIPSRYDLKLVKMLKKEKKVSPGADY